MGRMHCESWRWGRVIPHRQMQNEFRVTLVLRPLGAEFGLPRLRVPNFPPWLLVAGGFEHEMLGPRRARIDPQLDSGDYATVLAGDS